jgi:F0F1-type ATP synthase membrane subunit b/b'
MNAVIILLYLLIPLGLLYYTIKSAVKSALEEFYNERKEK